MNSSIFFAVAAAVLFGSSTPFAKLLVGETSPWLLGGLLYLGSGVGLALARLVRDRGWRASGMLRREWPWFLGAIFFGGMLAPVALMVGLAQTSAGSVSLLLNLEAVLTALIAWGVFQENAGRRVVFGMLAIVAGGVLLAWTSNVAVAAKAAWGPLAILLACACWAIDNNLTRKVSASDALFIAGSKGLIAGTVNCALGVSLGVTFPELRMTAAIMTLGFFGYGVSLFFFVLALRGLGAARTGAYFATAPFLGALVAMTLFGETASPAFWAAAALMAWGVWLHLTEQHQHVHVHEPLEHSHAHRHDAHHQHDHEFSWNGKEPHTHFHGHRTVTHKHPHFPDLHHRHTH